MTTEILAGTQLLDSAESHDSGPAQTKKKTGKLIRPVLDVFTATDNGDLDAVRTWITDFKIDPDSRDDLSQTLLMRACFARSPEIVSFLLSRGAFADTKGGFFGETPLLAAVSSGSAQCVRLLCENGHVNVNVKTGSGQTPLVGAARKGDLAIVKILLEFGAKVDARDQWGRTALIHAAQGGHADVIRALLGLDAPKSPGPARPTASCSKRDNEGRTALHEAALCGSLPSIHALLAAGAKLHRRDMSGYTPLDLAESVGKVEAAEVLARAWQVEMERAETKDRGRRASVHPAGADAHDIAAPTPVHGHSPPSSAGSVSVVAVPSAVPNQPTRERAPSIAAAFLTPASIAANVSDSETSQPSLAPLYVPGSLAGVDSVPYGHIEPAEMQSPLVQGLQRLSLGVADGDGQVGKVVEELRRVRGEVGTLGGLKRRRDDVKTRLSDLLARLTSFESDLTVPSGLVATAPETVLSPESPSPSRRAPTITSEVRERARRMVAEARQGVRMAEEGEVLCREWSEGLGVGKVLGGSGGTNGSVEARASMHERKEMEAFDELTKLLETNLELEKR
ncbi:hypothetical protein HDU93_003879 [Gonapodya sp. JEL0774]|nr:hypothetical protein HDU93_003879 [Gonapodya sp. JEL0774]